MLIEFVQEPGTISQITFDGIRNQDSHEHLTTKMRGQHNFKNLLIWQDAMEFCNNVYTFTRSLPNSERFNLTTQLERAAVSVASNIAEGTGKTTDKHFAEFLSTAISSAYEIETQLLICLKQKYGDEKVLVKLINDIQRLQKMIFNFRSNLK
jgi:four helix bundle protein